MRQLQITKQPVRRPRPEPLEPLSYAPPADTSSADDLLDQIDAVLAAS